MDQITLNHHSLIPPPGRPLSSLSSGSGGSLGNDNEDFSVKESLKQKTSMLTVVVQRIDAIEDELQRSSSADRVS